MLEFRIKSEDNQGKVFLDKTTVEKDITQPALFYLNTINKLLKKGASITITVKNLNKEFNV